LRFKPEDFAGASVSARIPIRESVINAFLRGADKSGRVQQIEVAVRRENLLHVGVRVAVGPFVKWFRPELILSPQVVAGNSARVVLTVASPQYRSLMWIAEVFAAQYFPRGFNVDGGQIRIDLTQIPQMEPMRAYLGYVQTMQVRTVDGVAILSCDLKI
jgi:hypothetical protein